MRPWSAVARVGGVVVLSATTLAGPAHATFALDPADPTFALDPADPTFALDPADATTTLERTVEEADDTVVTLTSDLLFDFGSADLTDRAAEAVAELAERIPQDAAVRVDGHTDAVGSAADNQALSEERARAVGDVLRDARHDLDLEVSGHGETAPVADNTTGGEDNPAGRALNRRVEVTYPTS
ncbi:OmpA family protein [Isoptericola halotolerans]|uniref:OmpA family protein n=1 Tax=Isoptericola halotolerans TaxID=300560 RepID=UPI00388EF6EA